MEDIVVFDVFRKQSVGTTGWTNWGRHAMSHTHGAYEICSFGEEPLVILPRLFTGSQTANGEPFSRELLILINEKV